MSQASDQRTAEFLRVAPQFKLGGLVTESVHPVTANLSETAKANVPAALRLLFDVDADVIVWCTGFKASEFLQPIEIIGRNGVRLVDQWSKGSEAYLGISVRNFPNLALLFGPNTNSITNTALANTSAAAR